MLLKISTALLNKLWKKIIFGRTLITEDYLKLNIRNFGQILAPGVLKATNIFKNIDFNK